MIVWILHNWYGYLLIRLHGFSPERFLNLCNNQQIEIWGLEYRDGDYEFYMTLPGYRKVKTLVRKAKVRLKIKKRFGLPFFLYRHRRRKLYFAGLAGFFVILYTMSLFIWDIEFEGNYRYTYDTLIRYFETQDIRYGMLRARVDCDEIEAALRTRYPEITWVSARVSGTRLLVKIKENEVLSAIPVKDEQPCDIVASKAGTINRLVVRQGVAQVAVGDEVEEGQLLVSGRVPIIGDNEEEITAHLVHADADVWATTRCAYDKEFPMLHTEQALTGKTKQGYYLKAGSLSATFLLPSRQDSAWNYVMEETQLRLFQNFYLPFYMGRIKGEEYTSYECFYTQTQLQQMADQMSAQFVKNLMQKGVQIIENNVKIVENHGVCHIQGNLVVREPIGRCQPMETMEEPREEETKAAQ